jgi:hypothetical protein
MNTRIRCAVASAAMIGLLTPSLYAVPLVGVTNGNTLIGFDSTSPQVLTFGKAISGLAINENIRGIDFRPTTAVLYALGSFGNLYTINFSAPGPATANLVFNLNSSPTLQAAGGLSGSDFGFDFNPQADAAGNPSLRIVSNTGQNLAVNVNALTVTVQTPVFYGLGGPTSAVGQAYSNSPFGGTTAVNPTVQYAIDSGTDGLVLQAFGAGTLAPIGPLGVNTSADVGFDIYTPTLGTNIAFATLRPVDSNVSFLYEINLITGAATNLGQIDGGLNVPNLAAVIVPEPATLGLFALGAVTLVRRRRNTLDTVQKN